MARATDTPSHAPWWLWRRPLPAMSRTCSAPPQMSQPQTKARLPPWGLVGKRGLAASHGGHTVRSSHILGCRGQAFCIGILAAKRSAQRSPRPRWHPRTAGSTRSAQEGKQGPRLRLHRVQGAVGSGCASPPGSAWASGELTLPGVQEGTYPGHVRTDSQVPGIGVGGHMSCVGPSGKKLSPCCEACIPVLGRLWSHPERPCLAQPALSSQVAPPVCCQSSVSLGRGPQGSSRACSQVPDDCAPTGPGWRGRPRTGWADILAAEP